MQYIYLGSLQIHSNTQDNGFVVYNPDEGFDFPDVRNNNFNKPGEHGAVVSNQLYGGRTIILTGRVSGTTIALHEQNRRALQAALGIKKDNNAASLPILCKVLTMDGLALQTYIYANKKPDIKRKSPIASSFLIELFAPDYPLFDQSQQAYTINIPSGGGVTVPVTFPMTLAAKSGGSVTATNSGDADSYPIVTFNGPLTSPYINNVTTGEVFKVNYTLAIGDILVCDMANKTMILNGITNALPYWDSGNSWMKIIPGANLLTLGSSLSADAGNTQVAFRNAYLGI
jgi:hypothetical protein